MTVILASGSPRRRELLARLGVAFEVVPSEVEERLPRPGEAAEDYARELARLKADDVAAHCPGRVVLGADTVVAVDGILLAKPEDEDDAVRMLSLLVGRTHIVATAVAVRGSCAGDGIEQARVSMRAATDAELRAYARTGEPMDKAGAYGIQGLGGELVVSVEGCYETVVGLPLCLAARLLGACGIVVPIAPSCRHLPAC